MNTEQRWFEKLPVKVKAYQTDHELDIITLKGTMHASIGDYIITGVNGEQYPCKPDIFKKTYKTVDENDVKKDNILDLSSTVELMTSNDWKDRFKAEYKQLLIRLHKLSKTCMDIEAGTCNFEPKCSLDILKKQLHAMNEYFYYLTLRSKIEDIDFN